MKTVTKNIAEIAAKIEFLVGETKSGKVCYGIPFRIPTEDFTRLTKSIPANGGRVFIKYWEEKNARFVSFCDITESDLQKLLVGIKPAPAKEKPAKKAGKKASKTPTETPTIDPAMWAQFQAFQAMLKASK